MPHNRPETLALRHLREKERQETPGPFGASSHRSSFASRPLTRLGFLFNHEQSHQIPHVAPIINAATEICSSVVADVFVNDFSQMRFIQSFITGTGGSRISFHLIPFTPASKVMEYLTGKAIPLRRLMALYKHRTDFADLDALVVPETTSLFLKTHFGVPNLKLVYTQHGAGDRAIGFARKIGKFDFVFVPGTKIRDRMISEGILRDGQYGIVGYPKFDGIDLTRKPKLFLKKRPTVLYNPHFHPTLSSWYKHGLQVLEYFANQDRYNLIFAPHVMLFSRKLHASSNPYALKYRFDIPERFYHSPKIHIDVGSRASMDMTYTLAADLYLGDVSSQVYEFLNTPKPCIFLNSHSVSWENDANYRHWQLGKVIGSPQGLPQVLADLGWHTPEMQQDQKDAFRTTFGVDVKGGARRAAEALLAFVGVHGFTAEPEGQQPTGEDQHAR